MHEKQDLSGQYARSWQSQALGTDLHVLNRFGDPATSWNMAYNLFADKLLGTDLIDESVSDVDLA